MRLYVGLGANLGKREETIRKAIAALDGRIGVLAGCSSFYETRPSGFSSPHFFINAVAAYDTALDAQTLLRITQETECSLGRTEKTCRQVYHDRPIDIDLLLLGDTVLSENGLQLPHPAFAQRRFVMEPLCELAPDLRHPVTGERMRDLLSRLNVLHIEKLTVVGADETAAVNRLLSALSSSAKPLTEDTLRQLVQDKLTSIYVGRDEEGVIQAMATLCLCLSPTGLKAWVEDVATAPECRGRGYGKALVGHLQKESVRLGASSLNLTSRPERIAANALYRKAGFVQRNTNVYRWNGDEKIGTSLPKLSGNGHLH